ncbi:hypothetical protein DYB32_003969 [Aphanomyces invadans]|uniref:RanBP2-type domain-containing protein n=1 Tax=Aphanomyces invadans TaxID=157072 RepID=A0A3R7D1W2_9STRA|nr:hypothetical protein DYB32_003969 [Aphanomyces invadans]
MNRQPRRGGSNRQAPRQRYNPPKSTGDNTVNSSIVPGLSVAIVQKHDQPTGRLTYGVVAETLTGSAVHPRGIKVRLMDGTVGRVQHIRRENDRHLPTAQFKSDNAEAEGCQAQPPPTSSLLDWIQPSLCAPKASPLTSSEQGHDHALDARVTDDDDDRAPWNCSACTFENSTFLMACEMCQTPK